MMLFPQALYRADQVRELDRVTIEEFGIPGWELMQRAGVSAFKLLRAKWPEARRLAVICGAGNNGGDGYVVAREALAAGWQVKAVCLVGSEKLRGDALTAYRSFSECGGQAIPFYEEALKDADVVVDGVLGTGIDRPVEGGFARAIAAINRCSCGVFSLDIPSGLSADTGCVMGDAVRARHTITFIGLKRGLFTGEAPAHCGEVHFASLDVPEAIYAGTAPSAELLSLKKLLPPRRNRCAHKGNFGHVLVVGGDAGFSGAAKLAAEAAARIGAGLVSVATHEGHAGYLNAMRPEIMCRGIRSSEDLAPLLSRATVVAVGPGLGLSPWAVSLFQGVIASGLPLVVDADALNLLAQSPQRHTHWVLTPHPGEAARLLGCNGTAVQADRFAAAAALQERYGGVAVLKGAGTLIHIGGDGPTAVSAAGNPGMASGGMGDVLTGVIAGLMAQGMCPAHAAKLGVSLHGTAADLAASDGERGLLAGDLMPHLRHLVNGG